jgi:hypothetical protein
MILSNQLNIMIERVHEDKENPSVTPTFYMALYLLDVLCNTNIFACINFSWHYLEAHVHLYCHILWDNKYKRSYTNICDFFLVQLYYLIFYRECPRLPDDSKKLISHIGNWYVQQDLTHIRIYGTTTTPHILFEYVPNRPFVGETSYHTFLQGLNASLLKE